MGTEPNETTVFVSDASAEAEGIQTALREKSLTVTEVPLAMLVSRVPAQRPRVVLVDADAEGALEEVAKMRQLEGAESIHVIFLGKPGGTFSSSEEALANEGSGFFPRPINIIALVKKIEALVASPSADAPAPVRPSQPPGAGISLKRLSQPPPPATTTSPKVASVHGPLSTELETLLADAEARVGANVTDAFPPSPEEELAAVLPEDVLRSLDEPIGDDDDAEDEERVDTGQRHLTSSGRETTGSRRQTGIEQQSPLTSEAQPGVSTGRDTGREPQSPPQAQASSGARVPSTKEAGPPPLFGSGPGTPPPNDLAWLKPQPPPRAPRASTLGSEMLVQAGGMLPAVDESSRKAESVPPPMIPAGPSVLGPGDAAILLARSIGDRVTGALCIDADGGIRRIVLREGDVVTAGSGIEDDGLLAFLAVRGDVPREVARQLGGRMPGFGKNAGAALIAHGLLTQDQLWPVLRAHAEWIIARALLSERGNASIEAEPPGRLKDEPNVFGGATGAAVFVDIVRRVIGPPAAEVALGGPRARFAEGAREALLAECTLTGAEMEIVERAKGQTLEDVVRVNPDSDVAPMLYALALLGVVEAIHPAERAPADGAGPAVDTIDAEAVRARVRARRALVDDGDYFALLGVGRNATGYEVRRAFLDLRRAFEPQRILSPQVADLADDVRTIVAVLEEAYEILRDPVRRERYRRAIDAVPS
jgi:hypothetical protein